VIYPSPVGYRLDLFQAIGSRDDADLTVLFCGQDTAGRSRTPFSAKSLKSQHVMLRGLRLGSGRGLPAYLNPGVIRWLDKRRADVVVIAGYSYPTAVLSLLIASRRGIPTVLLSSSHRTSGKWNSGLRYRLKRRFLSAVIQRTASFIVPGTPQKDFLVEQGADPRDVFMIGQSLDVASWRRAVSRLRNEAAAIRNRFGLEQFNVVSTVARLIPEKGIADLLIGFHHFVRRSEKWALAIAGNGPERARLETQVRLLEIPNVRFLGSLDPDAVKELYSVTDIFVLPSRRETWGAVINEALASGIPVIVSDRVGAAQNLVMTTGAGYVVPYGQPGAICRALEELAGDESKRKKMAAAATAVVESSSTERSAGNFVIACRHALSGISRHSPKRDVANRREGS